MSAARLASGFEVGALRRLAEQFGGSAVVARRGDEERGAILLSLSQRGTFLTLLERTIQADGEYRWQRMGPNDDGSDKLRVFIEKRLRFDPDSWLIDLDITDGERFIAEMTGSG